jgi:hypothetical protein
VDQDINIVLAETEIPGGFGDGEPSGKKPLAEELEFFRVHGKGGLRAVVWWELVGGGDSFQAVQGSLGREQSRINWLAWAGVKRWATRWQKKIRVSDPKGNGLGKELAKADAANPPDRGQLGIGRGKVRLQDCAGENDMAFVVIAVGDPFDAAGFRIDRGESPSS